VNGLLTSDDMDASQSDNITIDFWFYPFWMDTGDVVVEIFNGSTWETLVDLKNHYTYEPLTWCRFSQTVTDPQFFVSNFRIRIDSSGLSLLGTMYIDDVAVTINN
jgi:hypothetical protein